MVYDKRASMMTYRHFVRRGGQYTRPLLLLKPNSLMIHSLCCTYGGRTPKNGWFLLSVNKLDDLWVPYDLRNTHIHLRIGDIFVTGGHECSHIPRSISPTTLYDPLSPSILGMHLYPPIKHYSQLIGVTTAINHDQSV